MLNDMAGMPLTCRGEERRVIMIKQDTTRFTSQSHPATSYFRTNYSFSVRHIGDMNIYETATLVSYPQFYRVYLELGLDLVAA